MNDQTAYLSRDKFSVIPFVEIVVPYTEQFLYELEARKISVELANRLQLTLLQELSLTAERTIHEELNCFRNNEHISYLQFVETTNLSLKTKYPVLDLVLRTIAKNFSTHIQNIILNFSKDSKSISKIFFAKKDEDAKIDNIDTSLGDGHGGESTALVTLSNGKKIVYKPRNIDTTNSYNLFIDWVNYKLNTNLKTFKCVNFESYGWLEFVNHEAVNTSEELHEYYYKAGILLAVTLLLGSKDCHYENIIASGKNPVIVDHETIIQPVLSKQSVRTWDEQNKIPPFSVLESMLIANQTSGVASQYAGFGIKGNTEIVDLEKKIINANTLDSKGETRFIFRKLIKENVPLYKGVYVFVNDYRDDFLKGFEAAYDVFMVSIDELMSPNSPIKSFQNLKIRYVWRPTFVYFKILKYLKQACFMSSFEIYRLKLYELMSKAYKKENSKNYKNILACEMKQMLDGDIPIFNFNSSAHRLEEDKPFNIFSNNCIENIRHRIDLLSVEHKNEQIEYIVKWLCM